MTEKSKSTPTDQDHEPPLILDTHPTNARWGDEPSPSPTNWSDEGSPVDRVSPPPPTTQEAKPKGRTVEAKPGFSNVWIGGLKIMWRQSGTHEGWLRRNMAEVDEICSEGDGWAICSVRDEDIPAFLSKYNKKKVEKKRLCVKRSNQTDINEYKNTYLPTYKDRLLNARAHGWVEGWPKKETPTKEKGDVEAADGSTH
eukprot:TRINITY_DN64914_c1_g1_i1.p1 TRINITY_DN64914_c1_g1~~TRINITY_DN64914_c1_g1_i1.p1  ORF type:complete len:198 (-),score=31.15 TRINITY_DN64914_c1_g1_i1:114-707(-)